MDLLAKIYWFISRLYYYAVFRLKCGRNACLRLGGNVKKAHKITIGSNFFIGKNFILGVYKDAASGDEGEIVIGDNVCIQNNVKITSLEKIEIGNDVLIGSNVLICDNTHGKNAGINIPYEKQPCTHTKICIEEGVWIGEQVLILEGAKIGKKCIIGANSLVNSDIPAYSLAVGTPARVIKTWDFEGNRWIKV